MTNTNAEQTIITLLPRNDAAVICRHKSFLVWYLGLGLCRIAGFGDGCVFS